MFITAEFQHFRKTHIATGYRPDWVSPDDKPEYNGAMLLTPADIPANGSPRTVVLVPLRPELWGGIKEGSRLEAREGAHIVGLATVTGVFGEQVTFVRNSEALIEAVAEALYRSDGGLTDEDYEAVFGHKRPLWKTDAPWDSNPEELSEHERDDYRFQAGAVLDMLGGGKKADG